MFKNHVRQFGKFIASCRKEQGMTQAALVLCGVAAYVEMPTGLRAGLITFAAVLVVAVAFIAVGIEQKAGYYECQVCFDRHIPTYWQANLAPHIGRKRYMKCPVCGKRSYQKKVLTKKD